MASEPPGPIPPRLAAALADRYRFERELGAGGMATVYLAEDLKHHRRVAVKVLRPELSAILGAERFLKEIEVTANLQHPHILPLFDSGEADTYLYYVMPYVEGESLRSRLVREKQLGVDESVRIAREVLSALGSAHRQGVIHRDIKPENILLHDGSALVADFGIALAVRNAGGTRLTETGLSLGTPGYMSPEQATGERQVDARSDVYSVGCLLYEMLAGEPPHTGPTVQAIIAAIVTKDPEPIHLRRKTVPLHVSAALDRSLRKVPADRFDSADAFDRALNDSSYVGDSLAIAAQFQRFAGHRRTIAAISIGAAVFFVLGIATGSMIRSRRGLPVRETRFYVSEDTTLHRNGPLAISPDGQLLVFAEGAGANQRLVARRLNDLATYTLPGVSGPFDYLFFSPDGAWIGFVSNRMIRKVHTDGSELLTVTSVDQDVSGATWLPDGNIIFAKTPEGRLYRVSAQGGSPTKLEIEGLRSDWGIFRPWALPGGTAILCKVYYTWLWDSVGVVELRTGHLQLVASGSQPKFLPPGYLVAAGNDGSLLFQPFDIAHRVATGPAHRLLADAAIDFDWPSFDVSTEGTLTYLQTVVHDSTHGASLARLDRHGTLSQLAVGPDFHVPRVSPDGRFIAYGYAPERGNSDIWLYDMKLGNSRRVTFGGKNGADYNYPTWSHNGGQLVLTAHTGASGSGDLWLVAADGSAEPKVFLERALDQYPTDWTTRDDGIVFTEVNASKEQSIWVTPLDRSHPPLLLVQGQPTATGGKISPNGKWLAYNSDETGTAEVYVQAFPGPGKKMRVSTAGGEMPVWSRRGDELFYWKRDTLISAKVSESNVFSVGKIASVTVAPIKNSDDIAIYDVFPDGDHFVMNSLTRQRAPRIVVVLNVLSGLAH